MEYTDLIYEEKDNVAWITINRPEKYNAFRGQTVEELIHAFGKAGWNKEVGAIVLSGTGPKAFCTGGDQSVGDGDAHYDGRGTIGLPVEDLHNIMRDVPKPVIAKVRGFAIGGGNVLAAICDMTIASDNAIFGQVGPKMGSVDPGYGTAYLARVVGEKKAREIWFMCNRYTAEEAREMGLANKVVPDADLDAEVENWCKELVMRSPTAIAIAKRSINADTDHIKGIANLGLQALALYYGTDESKEGGDALSEKRDPEFRKYV